MKKSFDNDKLTIEKATQADWELVLQILEEAGLKTYFTGNENFRTFYTVKNPETKELICCFAIDYEKDIGILKSFAVKKELHGKGLGKIIVSKISDPAKRLGLKKLYATSWEAPNFWRKVDFIEIDPQDSTDNYYLKYIKDLEKRFPQYTETRKHFLLVI